MRSRAVAFRSSPCTRTSMAQRNVRVAHEGRCAIDVRVQGDDLNATALERTQTLDGPDAAHGRLSTVGNGKTTDGLDISQVEKTPNVASNPSARASAQAAALCASTFRTALIPQQIPVRAALFFRLCRTVARCARSPPTGNAARCALQAHASWRSSLSVVRGWR